MVQCSYDTLKIMIRLFDEQTTDKHEGSKIIVATQTY